MGQKTSLPIQNFIRDENSHKSQRRHQPPAVRIEKLLVDDQTEHYTFIGEDNTTFSFSDFIHTIKTGNQSLIKDLSSVFQETKFKAYFWECPPTSRETAHNQSFEFVLIASHELFSRSADPVSFSTYFNDSNYLNRSVISFRNLGGDAVLVVPSPVGRGVELNKYTHIANFMRLADREQIHYFWKVVGEALDAQLKSGDKVWLSTSGLGVSWLHVRVDNSPKYFNYKIYKNM